MPGSLVQRLKVASADLARERTVVDVRLGLGYTAVQLDDGFVGLAFTFKEGWTTCRVTDNGPLIERTASRALDWLDSDHPLEAALGLATANALHNRDRPGLSQGDALDLLDIRAGDRVGMVGLFAPLLPRLRALKTEVSIFELAARSAPPEGLLPASAAYDRLPVCQVALLTATTLINGTIEPLLAVCGGCREVVVMGASTPLCPSIFDSGPVTLLSGLVVENSTGVLRAVSEGGGRRALDGLARKVNWRVKSS